MQKKANITRKAVEAIPQILWDISDLEAATGMSARNLHERTKRGEIPHLRIGRRVFYRPTSIAQWLAGREELASAARSSGQTNAA